MIKARVVEEELAKLIVVNEPIHCSGCAVGGCGGKPVTLAMSSPLSEGEVILELSPRNLGLVLLNSLGLPLIGMVAGIIAGAAMQWGEGSQFVLGCLGFGMLAAGCRVFESSLITVNRDKK